MKISVIYSCNEEQNNEFFSQNLAFFGTLANEVEFIFVDGSQTNATAELLSKGPWKVIKAGGTNRAQRYNEGAKAASGDLLLFHHPRSKLDHKAFSEIRNWAPIKWGAFTHRFDKSHLGYKFTSWYSNHIRGELFHIYYLDHCLLVDRDLFFQINGFPEVEIFEDSLICHKLRRVCRPKRLQSIALTSSIRFEKNGFFKQAWINQKLKLQFYFRFKPAAMNRLYEKNLNLNENTTEHKDELND